MQKKQEASKNEEMIDIPSNKIAGMKENPQRLLYYPFIYTIFAPTQYLCTSNNNWQVCNKKGQNVVIC